MNIKPAVRMWRNLGIISDKLLKYYRNTAVVLPQDLNNNLTSTQLKIIEIIKSNASISVRTVAEQSGIPKRTVEFKVKKLKEIKVRKVGAKKGYFKVQATACVW